MRGTLLMTLVVFSGACGVSYDSASPPAEDVDIMTRAQELAHSCLIIDTHIDVPYRLYEQEDNISQLAVDGDFDYPRARKGGLDAAFMSIYVPASYQGGEGAKDFAEQLINMVEGLERDWPEKFSIAHSVAEIKDNFGTEVISLPMGIENGAALEEDLANVRHFYERGIRYITLAHSKANEVCDSSYDPDRKWNGLSPFGRKVIAEMNHLGIMVDVSHVSDETFFQVLEISSAPVIASHSSCRYFTPEWERNMSDDMIRLLGRKGGVIQISIGNMFLDDEYRKRSETVFESFSTFLEEHKLVRGDNQAKAFLAQLRRKTALPEVGVATVADHIDHVVNLAGVDHVGIGTDFDGVGGALPEGMEDVSGYPNLIAELLRRGYSAKDIKKIGSLNLLRVWSEVEELAESH